MNQSEVDDQSYYYQETALSYLVVIIGSIVLITCLLIAFFSSSVVFALIGFFAGGVLLAAFYRVDIFVGHHELLVVYGIGLFQREIPLALIEKFSVDANDSLFTRIYQPFSDEILTLHLRGGQTLAVATAEAKKLANILDVKRR